MKKFLICLTAITLFTIGFTSQVHAQSRTPSPVIVEATESAVSTSSATISAETLPSSASALLQQRIQEKTEQDFTDITNTKKDKLVEFLETNPISSLSWYNPLQHAIRRSVSNGLPANIVVLIMLFPLITSIIAFSRHVIGLKGFGVYTPAVLSVAFVSTGIMNGILMFLVILTAAIGTRRIMKKLNLQSLPRTAMMLWGVSIVTLLVLVLASIFPFTSIATLNIFPILIIMLLTENFMESQLASSQSEAVQLTFETLLTAIICSVMIGSELLQKSVLLQPELILLLVAAFNIMVGKYSGLRLLEWIRFRSVIE